MSALCYDYYYVLLNLKTITTTTTTHTSLYAYRHSALQGDWTFNFVIKCPHDKVNIS